jgi:hypothetical protein
MKRSILATVAALAFLVAINIASATASAPFASWDDLTQRSPDIVVACCTVTTSNPEWFVNGMIVSDVKVTAVLKGDSKAGAAKMVSHYWPHQGECFLMFSTHVSDQFFTGYNAVEGYRIIPINRHFQPGQLAGKRLTEQIRLILSLRLADVREELERITSEKNRLEQSYSK